MSLDPIAVILNHYPEVIAGYLFGSVAEGVDHRRSDLDIAVLLDEEIDKFHRFELGLGIGDELERRLRDLLILNQAPIALSFRAIRGKLVLERDPVKRSLFEARVMSRYYDHKRYYQFLSQVLRKRVEEGRFGSIG